MSTPIYQVTATNYLSNAEFIQIDIPGDPLNPANGARSYYFSSSYKNETIPANTGTFTPSFTALGGLVGVSGHQRDLTVTSYDTTVSLVGIDQTKIGLVIDAGLKGSRVQIWRGFYNVNGILDGSPVLRYTGIVTGYSINEERIDKIDAFTLALHCSSYKRVLESRISGRFTNPISWNPVGIITSSTQYDLSMDNVASLNNATFNFGQKI